MKKRFILIIISLILYTIAIAVDFNNNINIPTKYSLNNLFKADLTSILNKLNNLYKQIAPIDFRRI